MVLRAGRSWRGMAWFEPEESEGEDEEEEDDE